MGQVGVGNCRANSKKGEELGAGFCPGPSPRAHRWTENIETRLCLPIEVSDVPLPGGKASPGQRLSTSDVSTQNYK